MTLPERILRIPRKQLCHRRWRKWLLLASAVIVAAEGAFLASVTRASYLAEQSLAAQKRLAAEEVKVIAANREVRSVKELPPRTTFSGFLEDQGLQARTIQEVIQETRPVYNLASVRAGNQVTLITSGKGTLREVDYQIDANHILGVKKVLTGFHARLKEIPYTVHAAGAAGTVHDSLFTAVERTGEGDQLSIALADIFGWDLDFNTDTRDGDRFEVIFEKRFLNGKFAGYGRILAAEYDNAGHPYEAVLFHDPSGEPAYYAPSGKAMKKAFLRSPLRFAAPITSRFSYHRFHPILKRYLPHLGIDYGAPLGSRVQAVAEGRVVFAGWQGGGGKEVRLKHARGYETYYLHLSRILVHRGQHVHQGQIIALTGETGLATGPHLDFRIAEDGRFRNFLALKLPPVHSVARSDWPAFQKVRGRMLDMLASLASNAGRPQQRQASLRPAASGAVAGR